VHPKGWALWGEVCVEKNALQQEIDSLREKNNARERQDRLDGLQAGVHHDSIKSSVERVQKEKAETVAELQKARNAEANIKSAFDGKVREARELETVTLRLVNQIEQLESQGTTRAPLAIWDWGFLQQSSVHGMVAHHCRVKSPCSPKNN
jgi:chromosome segregation ATPase